GHAGPPGEQAIEAIGHASGDEDRQRPPQVSVNHEDHEGGDEEHPEQCHLIRRRQRAHFAPLSAVAIPASFRNRSIAATASAPLTALDGWKLLSGPTVRTPDATARDAATYARWLAARSENV